ncbi:MAG: hypothetical protein J2P48_18040 [Alphaproteobacteria bacterium]|nr:hypothetical protein [Alphaproteobacteria bacterium]
MGLIPIKLWFKGISHDMASVCAEPKRGMHCELRKLTGILGFDGASLLHARAVLQFSEALVVGTATPSDVNRVIAARGTSAPPR